MRTVVVGAGPTGLFTAIALARRGREVVVVDRDPGPPPSGQRPTGSARESCSSTTPTASAARWSTRCSEKCPTYSTTSSPPAQRSRRRRSTTTALRRCMCRRMTFERELRSRAAAQHGRHASSPGHVDERIEHDRGRAVGVRSDRPLAARRSGRSTRRAGRAGSPGRIRPPRRGRGLRRGVRHVGSIGCSTGRRHRADELTDRLVAGLSRATAAIAFLHDNGTFSITFTHDGADQAAAPLRRDDGVRRRRARDPAAGRLDRSRHAHNRSRRCLPGGRLYNPTADSSTAPGRPVLPGLISVGDAVCTTTPLAGRGVTLALMQARRTRPEPRPDHHDDIDSADNAIRRLVHGQHSSRGSTTTATPTPIGPAMVRRGRRPRPPLPSDLIVAAAEADPRLTELVAPYTTMDALPASLAPARARAREIYASGWRPPVPTGRLATNSVRWCPGHRQPLDPVDERRQQPRRFFRRRDVGHLAVQLLERDADLAAGEVGAEAEVRAATTEAGMGIRTCGRRRRSTGRRTCPRRGWPSSTTTWPCRPPPSSRRSARSPRSACGACRSPATPTARSPRPRWAPAPRSRPTSFARSSG